MLDITQKLVELIRLASTSLPDWVENRLRAARETELPGSPAWNALDAISRNVGLSRQNSTPICQDTGTPSFYIQQPVDWPQAGLTQQVRAAVTQATHLGYLRPNAIDPLTGVNSGDNQGGETFPELHFRQADGSRLVIDLLLKGGGCENVSAQYSLPDARLSAKRDLEGVRRVVLDAVFQAQGQGCAPGFLGVAIGGDRAGSYAIAKQALLDWPDVVNPNTELAALEDGIIGEANDLGIGPMGFGGKTTLLGTRIRAAARLPASYFVSVSYMCWAFRHRRMVIENGQVSYE